MSAKETRTWVVTISEKKGEAVGINHDDSEQRIGILDVSPFEVISSDSPPVLPKGTPLIVDVEGDLYFFELSKDQVLFSLTTHSALPVLPGSVVPLGTPAKPELVEYLHDISSYILLQYYKVYFPNVYDLGIYASKCTI